jgi:uncharacterized protein
MYATVSGFEIPTRDPERSVRFYHEVFDWSVEPVAWAGPPYYRVGTAIPKLGTAREGIDGGLTAGGQAGDQPLLVIHVADVSLEECLERIVAAGGAVEVPVTAVAEKGRFARFRDPEGNRLGLWQGAELVDPLEE